MPLSVDEETLRSLTELRNAGVAEAEFRSDGTLLRARFVPASTTAPSPAATEKRDVEDDEDPVTRARRSNYENLFNRPVCDDELRRLP